MKKLTLLVLILLSVPAFAEGGHPMIPHKERGTIEAAIADIRALPDLNRTYLLEKVNEDYPRIQNMEAVYALMRSGQVKVCEWTVENPSPPLGIYDLNGQHIKYNDEPQCREGELVLWIKYGSREIPFMSLYCGNLYHISELPRQRCEAKKIFYVEEESMPGIGGLDSDLEYYYQTTCK